MPDRRDGPDPVASEGVCAQALCAHALEPLSVAVARLIFRTRIAPGLIVTTLRFRAADLSAELFLDPLVANQLLPPTDHLASLPRLLATLSTHYSTAPVAEYKLCAARSAANRRRQLRSGRQLVAPTEWSGELSELVRYVLCFYSKNVVTTLQ